MSYTSIGHYWTDEGAGIDPEKLIEIPPCRRNDLICLKERIERMLVDPFLGVAVAESFLRNCLTKFKTITQEEYDWVVVQSGLLEAIEDLEA